MENLRSDLIKGSAGIEEDDEFYEEIEAPKFVDFTALDRSRQDDGSWFCVRIGCDQQHEQVDPDALHKSFKLRVMAARSPNLRLRKALNRQDPRSIPKCPHSAPTKSTNDRITRFSTVTAIPEKIGNIKLRNHPISSLRSTPKPIKAVVRPSTVDKALTTPRNKNCPSYQEAFRSVKHQKAARIAAPKNISVAKVLFFPTPKKTAERAKPSICAEMNQLKVGSLKKTVIKGGHCKSSRCAAYDPNNSAMSSKKKNEGSILQEGGVLHGSSNRETNLEGQLPSSVGSDSKDSPQTTIANSTGSDGSRAQPNSEENVEIASNREGAETEIVENPTDSDDNKENIADNYKARNFECENLQFENCKNLTQKATKAPSKTFQENQVPGGKHKRTTNPKPFRLRTDERGIMREANLGKRHQLEARKETASVVRWGDRMQTGARNVHVKLVKCAGAKLVANNPQCEKLVTSEEKVNNKITKVASTKILKLVTSEEKVNNKITKVASTKILKALSVTAARKAPSSKLHGDKRTLTTNSRFKLATLAEAQIESNTTNNVTCPKGKKGNNSRFHEPKGFLKRP